MRFSSISVIAKISISQHVVAVLPLQGIIIPTRTISILTDRKDTGWLSTLHSKPSVVVLTSLQRCLEGGRVSERHNEIILIHALSLTLSFTSLLFASSIIERKRKWTDDLSPRSCGKQQLVDHSKMIVRVSRSSDYSQLFIRRSTTSVMLWCSNQWRRRSTWNYSSPTENYLSLTQTARGWAEQFEDFWLNFLLAFLENHDKIKGFIVIFCPIDRGIKSQCTEKLSILRKSSQKLSVHEK